MKKVFMVILMVVAFMVVAPVATASVDYSTITFDDNFYYQYGTHDVFILPTITAHSMYGEIGLRMNYFAWEGTLQVVWSQDGENWATYPGFAVWEDYFPDYYVANSMMYIYATASDSRWEYTVSRDLDGNGVSGSLEFWTSVPGSTGSVITAHLIHDEDGDGLLNYQDADYNPYMVPEPATMVLLGLGAIGVLRRKA